MLNLRRKLMESITINNDTTVKILAIDIDRMQVTLGIDAPKSVTVDRTEIHIIRNKKLLREKND